MIQFPFSLRTARCDFRCSGDHKCLSQDLVCNGNRDCSDGSDESEKCREFLTFHGHKSVGCRMWVMLRLEFAYNLQYVRTAGYVGT